MFDRLRKSVMGADLPTEPVVLSVPDGKFGVFTVTGQWDPRVVTVAGPAPVTLTLNAQSWLPDALKRRLIWQVPPPRITPGTRDAVELLVDGQPAHLDCGRRAMRRSTYNVRASVAGREYHVRHRRRWRALLERNGQVVIRISTPDRGRTIHFEHEPHADAVDSSVAVAVGCTLGVGAPGFLRNLLANLP